MNVVFNNFMGFAVGVCNITRNLRNVDKLVDNLEAPKAALSQTLINLFNSLGSINLNLFYSNKFWIF